MGLYTILKRDISFELHEVLDERQLPAFLNQFVAFYFGGSVHIVGIASDNSGTAASALEIPVSDKSVLGDFLDISGEYPFMSDNTTLLDIIMTVK